MRAIFLGSFNPPHIGHLNVIQSVLESSLSKDIEKIHIIPCKQNPIKKESVPFNLRYKMCQNLFRGIDKVIIDDIENNHDFIYTYNMLKYFLNDKDEYIKHDFKWILTQETLNEITDDRWFKSMEILSWFSQNMIVVNNDGKTHILGIGIFDNQCVKLKPGINVHSTDIRNMVNENKSIDIFTKQGVIDVINENNLYK